MHYQVNPDADDCYDFSPRRLPMFDAEDFHQAKLPEPRPFQAETIEALAAGFRMDHRCQMVMAPTGAGKTALSMMVMAKALQNGKRAIFAVDRLSIMEQTSQVADAYRLPHSVLQAGHARRGHSRFQIASLGTIARKGWPKADIIFCDEAHIRGAWLHHVQNTGAYVVGLSATPFTKGLGKVFTRLINSTTTAKLVSDGVLVPHRIMECVQINMDGAKRANAGKGEWLPAEQEERGMAIVGDIVTEWAKHRNPSTPKGIVFGSTIAHCGKIAKQFNESGDPSLSAAVFSAETPDDERSMLVKEFRKSDSSLNILVSVSAISRGFDAPEIGTISMARPLSKSLAEYMQQMGRGLRSAPGKSLCQVLDHSGNARRFAEDFSTIYHDGLDKLDDASEKLETTIRKEPKESKPCKRCGYSPCGRRCASCGFEYIPPSLDSTVAGEMRELKTGKRAAPADRDGWWAQIVSHCRRSGNPETAVWRAKTAFEAIFKTKPPSIYNVQEVPVSPDVRDRYRKVWAHYSFKK